MLLIITGFVLLNIFAYNFYSRFAVYVVMPTKNGLRRLTFRSRDGN